MKTQENTKTLDQQFTEQSGIDVFQKKRGINLDPVIGMGVTRSIGTDSYPYTILDIFKGGYQAKTILKIQADYDLCNKYKSDYRDGEIVYLEQYRNHGLDGRIEYKDIKWNKETKRWNKGCSYYYASIGRRYYDLDRSL